MKIPTVDFTDPKNIMVEMFDDDRWVKDEFANHLAQGCQAFAEILAPAFANFPALEKLSKDGDKQSAMVANFIFGVMDDLVVSMKLLLSGKMIASGNMMRQAVEGVCVAVLCSAREPIAISKKENVVYWEVAIDESDTRGRSYRALDHLELNRETLGIDPDAIERFKVARKKYHLFSHPNLLSTATRMRFGELNKIFVGGTFDDEKIEAYRVEINERIGLSKILPRLIRELVKRLEQGSSSASDAASPSAQGQAD